MLKASSLMRVLFCCSLCVAFFSIGLYQINAQSQALNGQIEGVVTDSSGAAIANANVIVRNIETGSERTVTSDESGFYRAPLLPLGTYRVTVESPNFKRLVREGITLTTGETATINLSLEPGGVTETVTVTADAPIADPAKIDVGRVMDTREVQNLPLVSRNPYNYSLLQANVTGRPNSEFGVPRINANGYARRTNYQLDGNNNTQADRAGIRLMPISEIFVSEVQLVTNGFSAEFGNTPGLIMNAITPSGTNAIHGSASYRFRRTPFSSRPFNIAPTAPKPKTKVDNVNFAVGGPIIKNRWHYFGGFENVKRDLAGEPIRTITIKDSDKQALIAAGVSSSAFPTAIPAAQKVNFFIVRSDAQLTNQHRLTGRYNYFKNISPDNINGQTNTLQRSIDFDDISYSGAAQLISTFSPDLLNEFRFQYAKRNSRNLRNNNSGTGPSIVITKINPTDSTSGAALFGSPENADTIAPLETSTQFLDNFTLTRGKHTMKFGGGVNRIDDTRRSNVFARYTFPSLQAYIDAKNGTNVRSYTNYIESFGNPNINYKSTFYHTFVQDDYKITPKLKINYGLRYDLYKVPQADASSPFVASQKFKVDKNNFAPRLGIVYGLRDGKYATIVRASAGLYYEPPYLDIYLRALQNNGSPKFFNFTFASPNVAGAPAFPNTLGSLPAGASLPVQSIDTVSPDYKNLYAMHANFQIEQSVTNDISFTGGYIHSSGRHIPVYRNVNRINPIGILADGRPFFSTTPSAATRLDLRFNNILMVESVGNSNYNAATFQLNKRFSQGYQFSVNYTLSKSEDDAPEQNLVAASSLTLSDPTNRKFDFGPSLADQRHTFVMSFVGRPTLKFENKTLNYIFNNNQLGIIAIANSGERFNIVSNVDINRDGVTGSDRPLGIGRNSGKTPNQFNVDLRFSRFIPINERFKIEAFGEFVNVFNTNSVFQYNNLTFSTDANGVLAAPLPDFRTRGVTSLDSRQFQLGFKFIF
ncbi:MAG: TonB-dependent receptor [Acidobacteriota bacterium]|nr:TonB-dependent receptor [Acidobacteriota bacterium]